MSDQNILNLSALERASVQNQPYPYFVVENALNMENASDLLNDFPEITSGGSFPLDALELGKDVKELVAEFESDQFRQLMAKKFDVNLDDKPLMITARGYSRKKDGQIHTDSKSKLLTILIYLNEEWSSPDGRLRILNQGDNLDDFVAEISSSLGQLVAFKVTDNCWHGYVPYEGKRQSLQVNYLVSDKYTKGHVVRHKISSFFKKLINK